MTISSVTKTTQSTKSSRLSYFRALGNIKMCETFSCLGKLNYNTCHSSSIRKNETKI